MLLTIKRGLPLLGVLTGGMLVSSVAGTALLDQDLMLLGFFAGVVAAVGGIYVIKGRDLRMRWGFAACGLALLINIAFMQAASSVVLEFAGEPVAATVVAAREGYEGKGAQPPIHPDRARRSADQRRAHPEGRRAAADRRPADGAARSGRPREPDARRRARRGQRRRAPDLLAGGGGAGAPRGPPLRAARAISRPGRRGGEPGGRGAPRPRPPAAVPARLTPVSPRAAAYAVTQARPVPQ
ncbi:hypothetical protein ACFQZ4_39285 [Catellatospora coxensis]